VKFSSHAVLASLFLGIFVFFAGQGVFLILIPLRLADAGFSPTEISAVGAAYFLGVVSGAWLGARIVRTAGNIRAYAGSVAIILCVVLLISLAQGAGAWGILRFVHGAAAATTFLAVESWLHAATRNEQRGRVVGAYTALTLIGLGAGQLLINVYGAQHPHTLTLGAILFALSIAPIAWSRANAPPLKAVARRSLSEIYRHSPLALAGCIVAGLTMGAFWTLGPVFAELSGFSDLAASLFMTVVILGGLFLVWPFGRLSDFTDRRLVIAATAGAGSLASFSIAGLNMSGALPFFFAFLYGGVIFSLYPLSVSHAADRYRSNEDMLTVTRGLLLANGLGMAAGPIIAGRVIELFGPSGFFYFGSAMTGFMAVLALWRVARRPAPPQARRRPFAPVMENMPGRLAIDPLRPAADMQAPAPEAKCGIPL
jgi:MFS family permease